MDARGAPRRQGPAGHSSIFSPAKCFQSQLAGQPSPPKNRLFSASLPQPPGSETTSHVGYPSPPVSPPCRSRQKILDWAGFNRGPSLLPRPKSRCHPGVLGFVHLPQNAPLPSRTGLCFRASLLRSKLCSPTCTPRRRCQSLGSVRRLLYSMGDPREWGDGAPGTGRWGSIIQGQEELECEVVPQVHPPAKGGIHPLRTVLSYFFGLLSYYSTPAPISHTTLITVLTPPRLPCVIRVVAHTPAPKPFSCAPCQERLCFCLFPSNCKAQINSSRHLPLQKGFLTSPHHSDLTILRDLLALNYLTIISYRISLGIDLICKYSIYSTRFQAFGGEGHCFKSSSTLQS